MCSVASLCNPLLLLYKILAYFYFIEAIKLEAVLGLKTFISGFLTELINKDQS